MEARGGNGYIEDWVNPRLIRDAQVGLLWEGTSNINALDVIGRAVGKSRCAACPTGDAARPAGRRPAHCPLACGPCWVRRWIAPSRWPSRVVGQELLARQAATALYDAASAVLLAWEGSRPGADARRALVARFVLAHRLSPVDPLAPRRRRGDGPAIDALLGAKPLDLDAVAPLLV